MRPTPIIYNPANHVVPVDMVKVLVDNPMDMKTLERHAIEAALKRNHGNVTKTCKALGIGRTTLYRKVRKYKLECDLHRPA